MAVFETFNSGNYPSGNARVSRGNMSFDKLVKGATKPKHAAPKEKYISGLVTGTHESEYACSDIAQAIAPRLRDSNSTVVFKALIVTHLIIRSGHLKNVYSTWSSKPHLLGLTSVVSGHDTAQNLNKYARYLDTRLKTYATLGRDAIRDRAERRAEGRGDGGEKLRSLTVERGLLREVAALQKLMDSLLECRFYLEDREDEVTMSALRLLVKDLLILFTSVNEGVINVLEHYFEMTHADATTSLKIYKSFCKQTERVVTYLGVAKKMQTVLNVQVPNLKHAPVSLAGSLEEYLKDPNFEANRLEYKQNREIAEGKPAKSSGSKAPKGSNTSSAPIADASQSKPAAEGSSSSSKADTKPAKDNNKAFVDFFESIEQEQTSMFDPQTNSPSQAYFQQQATFNPFMRQTVAPFGGLVPQMTGQMAFGGLQPQMTGFSPFGMPANPFGQSAPQMLHAQPTGFLQPHATGVNPFRQSMLAPQMTGNPFGQNSARPMSASVFMPNQQQGPQAQQPAPLQNSGGPPSSSLLGPSAKQLQPQWTGMNAFQRPSSAPIPGGSGVNHQGPQSLPNGSNQTFGSGMAGQQPSAFSNPFGQQQPQQQSQGAAAPHPLAPQPTGSKNPFAPPPGSSPSPGPAKPPPPSMNQIAFQAFQQNMQQQQQQQQQQSPAQQPIQQQPFGQPASTMSGSQGPAIGGFGDAFGSNTGKGPFGGVNKPAQTGGGLMGSIASDFAFGRGVESANANGSISNGGTNVGQAASNSSSAAFGSGNAYGGSTGSSSGSNGQGPPSTGFNNPLATGTSSSSSGAPSFGFSSTSAASQNTGSSFGQGPGSQNLPNSFGSLSLGGQSMTPQAPSALQPQPTGFGGSSVKPFQPTSSFGTNLYAEHANKLGGASTSPNTQQQQQSQNTQNPGFNAFSGDFGNAFGSNNSGNAAHVASAPFGTSNGMQSGQGGGTPNPFRASMMPGGNLQQAGSGSNGNGNSNGPFGGGGAFSSNLFGSNPSQPAPPFQQHQQQPASSSPWGTLI